MKKYKHNYSAILFLLLMSQAFIIQPVYAAFQDAVKRDLLQKAGEYYYDGDFDGAIEAANKFISQANLNKADKKEAYILLVHIFLAKSEAVSAKKVVESIFDMDISYAPTLEEETPKYVTFVSEVKKQYLAQRAKPKKGEINWALWGGAGAGAALLIILLAGGGKDKGPSDKVLNEPPAFPGN